MVVPSPARTCKDTLSPERINHEPVRTMNARYARNMKSTVLERKRLVLEMRISAECHIKSKIAVGYSLIVCVYTGKVRDEVADVAPRYTGQ